MKHSIWLRAGAVLVFMHSAHGLRGDELPSTGVSDAAPTLRRLPPVALHAAQIPVQPSYALHAQTAQMAAPTPVPATAAGVLGFYQNPQAGAVLGAHPQRPAQAVAVPRPMSRGARPFASVEREPTISPYLNLFRDDEDNDEAVPNYFTLVRPQVEQRQINLQQQRELQRIESRVRTVQYEQEAGTARTGPLPATGHGTRFFNTGSYYSQPLRRR